MPAPGTVAWVPKAALHRGPLQQLPLRSLLPQVPICWRLVNERDPVPSVLPVWALFDHVGKKVKIDGAGLLMLEPSFLEGQYTSSNARVAAHYLTRYRKSLEGICENLEMDLPREVMPYGYLWSLAEPDEDTAVSPLGEGPELGRVVTRGPVAAPPGVSVPGTPVSATPSP